MTDAPDYVHLRVHSHYSLLTAPVRIRDLVAAAAADGQKALALTDNGNLFGAVEFYKVCRARNVKPILGMVAYCAAGSRREPSGPENPTYELTLLAETQSGWDNLKKLSTRAWLEGFHYRPRVDRELLAEHGSGIIALSGGMHGQIAHLVLQGDLAGAERTARELEALFGENAFYLEWLETDYEPQDRVNQGLAQLAERTGLPIVGTNDVHYLRQEDWLAQDILLCIRNGKSVSNPDRFRMGSRELHFKSRAEMAARFSARPDALHNTVAIAERCNVEIDFGTYHVPVFQTDTGETPAQYFERRCQQGARERYGEITPEIEERLRYEVGVIEKLGFVSYFLIVQDFILKAKEMGIPVGPGRGSAAGSIVAYALYITDVDPLRYNLIFERFLNAGRVSMPDIDIDFCGERRDEIIGYVREKYGADSVCQIITFGTMASRGVLRDVGRVLEIPIPEVDRIAKKVPQGPGASLTAALESDLELQQIRDESDQNKRLFELGLKLEGLARHSSIHAAGVVIGDRALSDYVPLSKNGDDVTTQWQMTELEEVGLLKMDFLGLKTLTILQEAVRLVRETHGVEVDLDNLPLNDAPTFELMARGDTQGIFQLESQGMRELLVRLRPDTFEDVIAVLALYRPGPLGSGMVDMFARRKHGEEPTVYPHDALQPVLEPTYGVIVYQEQVMQIANVIGGFSMNDADNLRKAMGKKKPEVMAKFKDRFVQGAVEQGYDDKFARELFETMEYFAGYGFNKSHSTAYALLTFRTAWLKAHYPVEFMAANLTVESGTTDKIKEFVDEARRNRIRILPPDVNRSARNFGVEDGAIRYGLGAIKGVGSRAAEEIAKHREAGGEYAGLEELCERLDSTLLNKTALEALVKAGALDGCGSSRLQTFEAIEATLRTSARTREDRRRGQGLLFAAAAATKPEDGAATAVTGSAEWPESEKLTREKEALGFYLSGHPFEKRGAFLRRIAGHCSADLAGLPPGSSARVAGMISGVRVLQIRSGRNAGQKMARFTLEDLEGTVSVTCFARVYQEVRDLVAEDTIVFVTGRLDSGGEDSALLCDKVEDAAIVVRQELDGLVLHIEAQTSTPELLDRIAETAAAFRGDQRLFLEVAEDEDTFLVRADRGYGIRICDDLIDELALVVGPGNLSFTRK